MDVRKRFLGWTRYPQAIMCFVALCLCIGALGTVIRQTPVVPARQPHRLQTGPVITPVTKPNCGITPCLAVTFDDGPDAIVTPKILDILMRQQVKATFFVVGKHVSAQPGLVQREYREGHEIGNHSWSHADLTKLQPNEVEDQIRLTQEIITSTGVPVPRLLRPPYGAINEMVSSHNQLTVVRWNIDPEDWKEKDPTKIHDKIIAQAKTGGIIILHDVNPATAEALEPALVTLKQRYQFVTVSQLLNLTPGDQGQFFGH